MRKKVLMDTLKSHFSTSCPASSADVIVLLVILLIQILEGYMPHLMSVRL